MRKLKEMRGREERQDRETAAKANKNKQIFVITNRHKLNS